MKGKNQHKTTITLELDEKEALWLKAYLLNPRTPVSVTTLEFIVESVTDFEMRKEFFETISHCLDQQG